MLACLVACGGDPVGGGACDAGARDAGATTQLFDGSDLAGWDGDPAIWSVAGGAIVGNGSTDHNTFLIFNGRTFGDFTLHAQVKIDSGGNSGIQFRSTVLDPAQFVVGGYQFEVLDGHWGELYEEALGRNLLQPSTCGAAEHDGDWNDVDITAIGCHIEQRLNGVVCAEFGEDDASRPHDGVVAIQYHHPGGFQLEVRDISVTELF